jgi:2-polyprenyl-6-methoxyphenol hydroxylase-like FAD-dependent oxidoreductase
MPDLERVIIAGAGIGGLTTAAALQQAGVETVVLERRHEPGALLTGGGFMLWHNAFLALREIGLDDLVAKMGQEIDTHLFRSDRDRTLAAWPVAEAAERIGAPAMVLRRSVLNSVLMEAVGPSVRMGAGVVSYQQDDDGVTVHLADGSVERGQVLIGADGLRSTVRDVLRRGHDVTPRYSGYTAWQAITRMTDQDQIRPGTFYNYWGRGGLRFLYCRLNEQEVYWDAIVADRVGELFDTVQHTKQHVLAQAYRRWPEPIPEIVGSTPEEAILSIDIFDRPPQRAGAWGSGRVVLIGDAAHPMTLNLSQGAGQSIEDAVVLSRLLTGGSAVSEAITEFERRRRARTMAMVTTSWNIGAMGRWRDPIRPPLRDVFMRVFFGSVGLKQSYDLMMDVDFGGDGV